MERQRAILCSNHLVFINASQHKLGVDIKSRKLCIYSWSGQNWAGRAWLTLTVRDGKAGLWFSEAVSPAAQGPVVVALRVRLSPSGQEGLVVLRGDKGGLGCTKPVIREEFKVRCTKQLSDIYGFCKT